MLLFAAPLGFVCSVVDCPAWPCVVLWSMCSTADTPRICFCITPRLGHWFCHSVLHCGALQPDTLATHKIDISLGLLLSLRGSMVRSNRLNVSAMTFLANSWTVQGDYHKQCVPFLVGVFHYSVYAYLYTSASC